MHIGFMIQNEAMLSQGKLLMKSLERTSYESVRIMVPEDEMELVQHLREEYPQTNVLVQPFSIPERFERFPFVDKLMGAAMAESMVDGILLWMDTDSIVFQDLSPLELKDGQIFAYRPVDKKLIGCGSEEPLTGFWQQIYGAFELEDAFLPIKTGVERMLIRPYYNAGCFMLRTDRRILQFWQDVFFAFVDREEVQAHFEEHILYKIFLHQAVLTGAVLASTDECERVLMPDTVNYPIQFHALHPIHEKVETSKNLMSGRYDTYFNLDEEERNFPFDKETASWIDEEALKMEWFYE